MEQRVDEREWVEFQWPYVMALLGGESRVSELAYASGAFTRRREIEKPSDLLRLILTWAVAERSLRETATLAAEIDLADVSDVALIGRFKRATAWLGSLLGERLGQQPTLPRDGPPIRVLDATAISGRGSKGTDRRIHLSIELGTGRIRSVEMTDAKGAESLERVQCQPGEIILVDRGYAHRKGLAHVAAAGAYFVVRSPWSSIPLEDRLGQPFDLFAALKSLPDAAAGEFAVQFRSPKGEAIAIRLVAIRKTEVEAARARQTALASARRHSNKSVDIRTMEAAGYVFLFTNAPEQLSAESVLDLYRFRWQIEMKFKALKSVLHLGNVPTRNGELLSVYLLAKMLVALLIDELIYNESFSPWGYPIKAPESMASHTPAP
jgi:hypothetical protein